MSDSKSKREQFRVQEYKLLPEIYQIEMTNRCNLKCPMCLRTTDMVRDDDVLDPKLLELMHERGDFGGSYYVELQMAGEPTLHPKLADVIAYLKGTVGVMVGLSTHGLLIGKKASVLPALMELNDLTISVDSVDPEVYAKMRYPAKLPQLLAALEVLFAEVARRKEAEEPVPFIELQLVATPLVEGSGDVGALQALMAERGWDEHAAVRVTNDSFVEMQGRGKVEKRSADICLNPFSSVSIAHNGDVVSCCYIFDPKRDEINYYGNLYDHSLGEIWASERVQEMRRSHIEGRQQDQCASCYLYSPMAIHQNIVARSVQSQNTGRVHLPVF